MYISARIEGWDTPGGGVRLPLRFLQTFQRTPSNLITLVVCCRNAHES